MLGLKRHGQSRDKWKQRLRRQANDNVDSTTKQKTERTTGNESSEIDRSSPFCFLAQPSRAYAHDPDPFPHFVLRKNFRRFVISAMAANYVDFVSRPNQSEGQVGGVLRRGNYIGIECLVQNQ